MNDKRKAAICGGTTVIDQVPGVLRRLAFRWLPTVGLQAGHVVQKTERLDLLAAPPRDVPSGGAGVGHGGLLVATECTAEQAVYQSVEASEEERYEQV